MELAKLRKGDALVLLPSGEETFVKVAGKNTFTVQGHIMPLAVRDEYDPRENPSGSWCRLEKKSGWNTGP